MSLNIKNARTVELVRELARRTGLSQTGAVEEAVRAKLAEVQAGEGREARRTRIDVLLEELDQSVTAEQKKQIRDDERHMYDDRGVPT
ncbi:type II toxin-antitoxin system VapB family antitoxin [Mycolicibacterium neoaurum]|uniref:type II toxin-antitoxin system VapB family antitoxin n=1 Tax=Mycolicibacterium neoaurum TaxID=1795 RepID=UPI001BCBA826|nr:type II toxin-antitoxin system VapB family antitoxin [Mycolicibacterium neoaurum]QVI26778.1 type II toxin-antitoxin system VapB family antitoxin [Mycolicibacterium neoaurum]